MSPECSRCRLADSPPAKSTTAAQTGQFDGVVRPVDRMNRPHYAVWEVTLKCDLRCIHCGSRAGKARPNELDTGEALDLVDQMADLGVKELSLIGGEVYLRADWLDIVRRCRDRDILVQMTTGAWALTRDRLAAARDAGLQSVSVSVDGLERTHDLLRGRKGSFAAVQRTFADLRELGGVRITANTQINRTNLGEIEPLFAWLIDQGIVAWQVQLTAAMGRAADEPGVLLQPYQVLETHPVLVRCRRYGDARGVRTLVGNNIGYFGPFEHILRHDCVGKHRGCCGAGRKSLGIEADGNIKGCPSLPSRDYVGGNIRDHRLIDIWERSKALRFTRDISVNRLSGFCATCYYREDCYGGCHWTATVLIGDIGNNPYCHHRAVELLERGLRERVELGLPAPGLPFDHAIYRIIEEEWPSEFHRQRALEITRTAEGTLLDEANGKSEESRLGKSRDRRGLESLTARERELFET